MDFDASPRLAVQVRRYGRETRENGHIGEEMVAVDMTMAQLMEHVEKVAFHGGTVGTGKQPPRPFLQHQWVYTHQNAMQRYDFEHFPANALLIRTDFAAQHEMKPQDTKTCPPPSPHACLPDPSTRSMSSARLPVC